MPDVLAGMRLRAGWFTPMQEAYDDTVISAGAAAAWFSGTPGVNLTFVPPLTGKVRVSVGAVVDTGAAGSAVTLVVSYRIHEGTDSSGVQVQAETLFRRSVRYQVFTTTPEPYGGGWGGAVQTGLDPTKTHWVEWRGQQLATAGGSVQIRSRQIIVEPVF
jgi:hypothetical protein